MAGSQKQTRKENRASNQGIFQDLEHGGCQPTVGGPFLSLLLSPSLSSPFSSPLSLLSPEAGEGCCAKVGGINPPEGVWETPWRRTTTATVVPDTIIGQQSTHGSNFIRRTDTRLISSYTNKSRQRMPIFAEFIERSCLSASCSHWCAEVQCGWSVPQMLWKLRHAAAAAAIGVAAGVSWTFAPLNFRQSQHSQKRVLI